MKRALLFVVFIWSVLISCSRKKQKSFDIDPDIAAKWKKDSIGCAGLRYKIRNQFPDNSKFRGVKMDSIRAKFGDPNKKRNLPDSDEYIYYVSCKYAPTPTMADITPDLIKKFKLDSNKIKQLMKPRISNSGDICIIVADKNDVVSRVRWEILD
jgi:hypothetical protein